MMNAGRRSPPPRRQPEWRDVRTDKARLHQIPIRAAWVAVTPGATLQLDSSPFLPYPAPMLELALGILLIWIVVISYLYWDLRRKR